ncbi:MAG: DUF72 domain-containing protein [Thermoproteales archaeon]|nr:DUF72 domain-containing protein [Thermoproteales archaeon]
MLFFLPQIYIGTSGWSYEDWIGPFYSSKHNLFSQYTEIFSTAEINSTFYSFPSYDFMKKLSKASPPGFKFSLKLTKILTHKKLLNPRLGIFKDLEMFLNNIKPLKDSGKLGAILIQMPPKPPSSFPYFEEFISKLPSDKFQFAVEFRHIEWLTDEYFKILNENNIACVTVDEPLLPPVLSFTADFSYFRWHGRGRRPWYYYLYSEEELKEWVPKIREAVDKNKVFYGYFNNHFRGYAPRNALQMLKLLGIANRRQRQKLKEIDTYFKETEREKTKESIIKAFESGKFEDVLKGFSGIKRYERAVDIPDSEVYIREEGEKIYGKVKEYKIIIDLEGKDIIHNCEDWKKRVEGKKFCKHVTKFFLALPRNKALRILEDIVSNFDEWSFVYEG